MRELLCLLCMAVLSVRSQIYPRFEHPSNTYLNNSFIDRGVISQDSSALRCVTDHTPCCDSGDGNWRDPQGVEVHEGISGATDLYVTRGTGTISLNRISGGSSGMWRCNIPDSSGDMQSMYIYLGNSSTGSLRSAVVSFTSLHTQANVDPPQFTLTCCSEWGPATNVSWQRDFQMIEEDSDHVTSQILVATEENTVYENKLAVTGREAGQYQCTVSSNRDAFFGATGSTITSEEFAVEVAGEPDRVSAVQQSDTSILVTWDPPGNPVTGYKVFYEPGGFLEVTGGSAESILLENLQNGVEYSIYVVALSAHLPSTVGWAHHSLHTHSSNCRHHSNTSCLCGVHLHSDLSSDST